MKTALDIINRAASKIGVKRSGVPLTDDEINDFISELNNMMLTLEAAGTKLNYTIITNPNDEMTTPDWSWGGIESNLAVRAAPDFDAIVTQALASQASSDFNIILRRTVEIGETQFSNTLPIGAGNEYTTYERFFKDTYRDDLETSSGGTLSDLKDINIREG